MYQLYKLKEWFRQTFFCIHEWRYFEVGIERQMVRECKKCEKFEVY